MSSGKTKFNADMKNLVIFPMQGYYGKIIGIVISTISILLLVLTNVFENFKLFNLLTNSELFQFSFWFVLFGFYLIAFSKEKVDSERVRKIRSKSLQIAFGLLISLILSTSLLGILANTSVVLDREPFLINLGIELPFYAAFGLLVYLISFHIGLYFDPNWIYEKQSDTVVSNLKNNKMFFIVYTLIMASLVFISFII